MKANPLLLFNFDPLVFLDELEWKGRLGWRVENIKSKNFNRHCMNLILFDDSHRDHLLPLTYTRPVAMIRIGILTIAGKWEKILGLSPSFITKPYLSDRFPLVNGSDNLLINGGMIPSSSLIEAVNSLPAGHILMSEGQIIAGRMTGNQLEKAGLHALNEGIKIDFSGELMHIRRPYDIFRLNGFCLESDFELITRNRTSMPLSSTNRVIAPENIFIEEGATVECAILNASKGPVYIGRNAEVMEGSVIRGPFALCEESATKLASKIYGPTTIGPYSKVGGELNNVVIFGYSNKAHDGFLGNAVIGEWCNLGADTNNSNLKNNYDEVRLWDYPTERFEHTGLQFCGLIMGDHSKSGINTMFNTGTVVGVSANIYGSGFPRNFIPSFSWGGASGMREYKLDQAIGVARTVMSRRGVEMTESDMAILTEIFRLSAKFRRF
jgi:UDP-N-acetylglucosamine diphosphorylase/glucosamine-1-phosphate N-acetyltransferase